MPKLPIIFISATTKDLRSCRQLVRDALLTIGCMPIVEEHFAPDARVVRDGLRAKISACDALIHLAGFCSGSEPSERDPMVPRRSFTQLEYDVARELKKPVYSFICTEDFPFDAHEPEPADLSALQNSHRVEVQSRGEFYLLVRHPQELALRVRELQTRVDLLVKDLQQTRSWLARGVMITLGALALIGVVLFEVNQRSQRIDTKVVRLSDELDQFRLVAKAIADNYGNDIEPGRTLTEQEKFDRALVAVARQQNISVPELKTWLDLFVTQVRANPAAGLYDLALADFAEKHFAAAATNARKSAEQSHNRREAAEKEASAAAERATQSRKEEILSWTLAGKSEMAAGHPAAAIEPYRHALTLCEENTPPLVWCDAAQNLGIVLEEMGRYEEAESIVRELLAKRSILQGPDHSDTLGCVNNLALILDARGNMAGAEDLYRRLLEMMASTSGSERPNTLASACNLANLLRRKGDLNGAETLYRNTLEAQERVIGAEDPVTLNTMTGLALLLSAKNDFAGAEPLYRRVLAGRQRIFGPENPATLASVENLALLLSDEGDLAGAEPLYRQALKGLENVLAPEHPNTLLALSNLSAFLAKKGDLVGAEPLARRVLEAQERILTKTHPDTAKSAFNLSILEAEQGKMQGALPLALEAVTAARASLPADHPYRLRYEKNLEAIREVLAEMASQK